MIELTDKDKDLNFKLTEFKCPVCNNFLYSKSNNNNLISVWCGSPNCPSVAANEGGWGKNELAAYNIMMEKMRFS